MLERLMLALLMVVIGILLYRYWSLRQLRQAPQQPTFRGFQAGKPALVLFTADYCTPCRYQQQPAIQRLLDDLGHSRFQLIKVDVETEPELAEAWHVMSLPTTFVLDAQGMPRSINPGVTSTDRLKQQVQALTS